MKFIYRRISFEVRWGALIVAIVIECNLELLLLLQEPMPRHPQHLNNLVNSVILSGF